jgi:hypothetical protein
MRTTGSVLVLAIAAVHAACGGGAGMTSPSAVSAAPLARFNDPDSDLTTTDVRDAQDEIVQFTTAGELVWAADGSRFPGYIADGRVITADKICEGCYFYVRFGTRDGERRAYLSWAAPVTADHPATLLDVAVIGGVLVVHDTDLVVPEVR